MPSRIDGGGAALPMEALDASEAPQRAPASPPPDTGSTVQAYGRSGETPGTAAPAGSGISFNSLFSIFSHLGDKSPQQSQQAANVFDFATVLGHIFDFAKTLFAGQQSGPSGSTPSAAAAASTTAPADAKSAAADAQEAPPPVAPDVVNGGPPVDVKTKDGKSIGTNINTRPAGLDESRLSTTHSGIEEHAHVEGRSERDGVTMQGSADARAYAQASATGGTFAGPDGVGVYGRAEASVGVSASAQGSITSEYGSISGKVTATAELYARAEGYAKVNEKGAEAAGKVEVGAVAKVTAESDMQALGGLVKGHADASAEAGTGAKADAKVGVQLDPPSAAVNANAGAFAGARAHFAAQGGVAGCSYGVEAEAWAGVGVKASVNAGISDGKLSFEFGIGASIGVGCFFKVRFEVDLKSIGDAIGNALGTFSKGAGDVFGGIFGAVAGLFGGGKGDGSHANNALSGFLQKSYPEVAQAFAGKQGSHTWGTSKTQSLAEPHTEEPAEPELGDFPADPDLSTSYA